MKYITKIRIEITVETAKDLIEFYNIKKHGFNFDNSYKEKSLELWRKRNDQQMINYFANEVKINKDKINIEDKKIAYLEEQIKKNPNKIEFDIVGKEFEDFKTEYLRGLHIKYNEQYETKKRKARSTVQMTIEDFTNRDYFDKDLPNNAFIPYCATDIYFENVPNKLIEKIKHLGNESTINCLLDSENTKKAKEAINKDEKTEETKQALIRKQEQKPQDKIKVK